MPTNRLVDAQAVARRFAVSIGTVNRWVRSGVIPCLRPSRRVVRFNLSEVEASLRNVPSEERESGAVTP